MFEGVKWEITNIQPLYYPFTQLQNKLFYSVIKISSQIYKIRKKETFAQNKMLILEKHKAACSKHVMTCV